MVIRFKINIPNSKVVLWGLPWWCSGWESACQCRGQGLGPWSGKISHAAEQLSPCATIAQAHTPRARALEREATAVRSPCTATRESAHAATRTQPQHSQK